MAKGNKGFFGGPTWRPRPGTLLPRGQTMYQRRTGEALQHIDPWLVVAGDFDVAHPHQDINPPHLALMLMLRNSIS